jgi:hypothetical protein
MERDEMTGPASSGVIYASLGVYRLPRTLLRMIRRKIWDWMRYSCVELFVDDTSDVVGREIQLDRSDVADGTPSSSVRISLVDISSQSFDGGCELPPF